MKHDLMHRYAAAKLRAQTDPEEVRGSLLLATGFLLGGGMPGCAAAVEIAFRKLFPDSEFPKILPL